MTDVEHIDQEGAAENKQSRVRSKVFLSYSHADKDTDWFKDVHNYLEQFKVGGEIELWDDSQLVSGDDWLQKIEENLKTAIAAVFLVTPTFLTSKFIVEKEVPALLERLELDGLIVHVLMAKPTNWELGHPIGKILERKQLLHSPERPLEAMENAERSTCLHKLVKQISEDIGVHRNRYGPKRRDTLMNEILKQIKGDQIKEVAGGENCIIYRTHRGTHDLAVKAMVSWNISDAGQEEIESELKKCRGLQNPAFIRIYDVSFEKGLGVVTADWVPGQCLKRIIDRANQRDQKLKWWERATSIVLKLAEAFAEGHERNLRYLTVTPANILLHRSQPRIYPIDFSLWIASTAHGQGSLSFQLGMLEYIAPEYLAKPADRNHLSLPGKELQARELEMTKKANQYSLAIVALALLEGVPPVKVQSVRDIKRLLQFQDDPRKFRYDDKVRLGDREWCRALPGLARVIWKMLAKNTEDLWENMAVVADQLHAIVSSFTNIPTHVSETKDFYAQYLRKNEAFYLSFYENLYRLVPDVVPMFADVDMARQRRLLDGALERLLNFRPNQCEPTTLTEIAEGHRRFDLSADHFEKFGIAFLEALDRVIGVDNATRDSWEAVLWPGLEYMKVHATNQQAVGRVKQGKGVVAGPDHARLLPDRFPDGRYSFRGTMRHFGVSKQVVRRWISEGILDHERANFDGHGIVYWISIDKEAAKKLEKECLKNRLRSVRRRGS